MKKIHFNFKMPLHIIRRVAGRDHSIVELCRIHPFFTEVARPLVCCGQPMRQWHTRIRSTSDCRFEVWDVCHTRNVCAERPQHTPVAHMCPRVNSPLED